MAVRGTSFRRASFAAVVLLLALNAVALPGLAQTRYLTLGGGTIGGSAYIIVQGIATLINRYIPGVEATAEPGSVVANIAYVNNGEMDIGDSQLQALQNAWYGQKYMAPFGQLRNIRGMLPGPVVPVYFLVLPDSPVQSLADIRGMTISMGGVEASAEAIEELLKEYGLVRGVDYEGRLMGHQAAVDALKDGQLDVAAPLGAVPAPAVMDAITSRGARIIPVDADKLEALNKRMPFFLPFVIPGGSFPGHPDDILTLAVSDAIFTRADLDEELVYQITRLIIERNDELVEIHPGAAEYNLETVTKTIREGRFGDVPLHPGAERYFREIGILE